jgi:hypothetical protein
VTYDATQGFAICLPLCKPLHLQPCAAPTVSPRAGHQARQSLTLLAHSFNLSGNGLRGSVQLLDGILDLLVAAQWVDGSYLDGLLERGQISASLKEQVAVWVLAV